MFAGMLIYYLFSTVMENVLDYFFSIVRYIPLVEGYGYYFQINYASMLYQILVYGPLSYGLAMFLMTCFREKNVNYGLTLEGLRFLENLSAVSFIHDKGMALVSALCSSGYHSHIQVCSVLLSPGGSS